MNRLSTTSILLAALLAAACSGPAVGTTDIARPTFQNFGSVNDALGYSCGTLDCHGQIGRNLQVWSRWGMRLQSDGLVPGAKVDESGAEARLTYRSVVGLEPELMSQVVKEGGRDPQRLTLIRKARGTEAHKGHKIMSVGSPLDRCITSWLAGQVNVTACNKTVPQ